MRYRSTAVIAATLLLALRSQQSQAVPAFAAQTGQPCVACHIGGFGPELTEFGRLFKITGYTLPGGSGVLSKIPLSLFVQGGFTLTSRNQPGPAAQHYGSNGNFAVDQISAFLAGRVNDHFGGFVQGTFNGVTSQVNLDNTDLRFTTPTTITSHFVQFGLSLNNGPMVQDPYATTYAWNFPFYTSQLAPVPTASTVLGGPLLGNTIGLTGSAWIDHRLYIEAGAYDTMAPGLMSRLGEAYGPGSSTDVAPYARIAYEWRWDNSSAHIGGAVFHGRFNPAQSSFSANGSMGHDSFTDLYADAGYQFITSDCLHTITLNGFYNHEKQSLDGSARAGAASQSGHILQESRLTATYYYKQTYGLTLSWEKIWGTADALLYQSGAPFSGSANGKPDSNAFITELDWVPFGKAKSWLRPLANLKIGLQYTAYTQFNGRGSNYDGFGRSASDNNTLFLYAWLVF